MSEMTPEEAAASMLHFSQDEELAARLRAALESPTEETIMATMRRAFGMPDPETEPTARG